MTSISIQIQAEDIITNILSRLPVKSISRFRCVSKTWCKLLNNPHFIKTQLNHALQNNVFSLLVLSLRMGASICDNNYDIYSVDYDSITSTYRKSVKIGYKFEPNYTTSFDFWGSSSGLICFSSRGVVCLWNPTERV